MQGVVMGVPFVDCLTTMLDPTIPLTVIEYDEWGNPNEEAFYNYIRSYSPMDNIKAQVRLFLNVSCAEHTVSHLLASQPFELLTFSIPLTPTDPEKSTCGRGSSKQCERTDEQ